MTSGAQFMFLLGAIYTAPHVSNGTALVLVLALLGTVLGLLFAVKDRK